MWRKRDSGQWELTKKFEESIGNNIDEALSFFESQEVISEITIVVKGIKAKNHQIFLIKIEKKRSFMN